MIPKSVLLLLLLFICFVNLAASCTKKHCQRRLRNWAGNVEFGTDNIVFPSNPEEVIELVKNCREKLHVVGSAYSFSSIASTTGVLLSLARMNKILEFDATVPSIRVQAGLTYSDLVTLLDSHGYALQNLASVSGTTIVGAAAVSAHGSGLGNGILASQLLGLTIVLANGTVERWNRTADPALVDAAAVSLGALGIVTELTLRLEPTYRMQTHVFQGMNWSAFVANFHQIVNDGYSVTIFFDWSSPDRIPQIWLLNKIGDPNFRNFTDVDDYFGATALIELQLPPMDSPSPGRVSPLGTVDVWYRHLLYLGLDHGAFAGAAVASEYFVPLSMATAALEVLRPLAAEIANISLGNEFRVIGPDSAWMSVANGENINGEATFSIDMSWKPTESDALYRLLPKIEAALAPFNARPHWGKLFTMAPHQLLAKYSRSADFKRLARQLDPNGRFMNRFLRRNVFF